MANILYFADTETGPVKFDRVAHDGSNSTAPSAFKGWDGSKWLPVSRKIVFKSRPSRHQCDDRCLHATGKTMQCECACGGANHGKGNA